MKQRVERYTIYAKPTQAHPDENLVILREGFSFWAFLLHALYLLYNRQWLALIVFLPLYIGVLMLGDMVGLPDYIVAVMQLATQIWLGASAYDLHRAQYELRGWKLVDVAIAPNAIAAEQRYLDAKHQPSCV
jgi:hypothetical protein